LKPKEQAVPNGTGVEKALHKFLVARAKHYLMSRGGFKGELGEVEDAQAADGHLSQRSEQLLAMGNILP
jgi:hypothetical protein